MTRLFPVLAAALVCAVFAPAAGAAKSTFTIRGAGFGHGVGMSQYGALGYAQHGWTAPQILAHYYTGTALGTTDPARQLRIELTPKSSAARVSGARQAGSRKLDPAVTYTLTRSGLSQIALSARGKRVATFTAPLQIAGLNGVTALAGKGSYRGVLEFKPTVFGGLSVINQVGLDDYVQGVVPVESPASWPAEALRAQAITARTYAITTSRGEDFDHYADTRSQVYGGVSVETAASNASVSDTRGQVVTYEGQPVTTYFFSTSGGKTESVENTTLSAEPKPWLKSVDDPYDDVSPRHRWRLTMKRTLVARKLEGLVKGSFRGIRVLKRGESPRIVAAEVVGSRGSSPTDGATLRARLGLFDSWAYFTTIRTRADRSGGAVAPRPFAMAARRAAGAIRGSVIGPKRGTAVTVQERRDGAWVDAGATVVGKRGAYRWNASAPGQYRVLVDRAVGPVVRVR
jgi:stage II sporulation protein D